MTRQSYYIPKEVLGETPKDWQLKRLRFLGRVNIPSSDCKLPSDALVSFIPMDDVGEYGGLNIEKEKYLEELSGGYTYFSNGDVLVAKITPCFENGKGALAEGLTNGVGFGTTELHVIRSGLEIDKKFLFYFTISDLFRKLGEAYMYGASGHKRVPELFLKDFFIALPTVEKQHAIVQFLDEKTEKIDALIAKKKELLDLLEEKRIALITQAVTKGLNPKAPMKDSGVPWLGEIPKHWEIKRLKFLALKTGSGVTPRGGAEAYVTEGVALLRSQNIHYSGLRLEDVAFIDEQTNASMEGSQVLFGDILLNITGASLGRVTYFDKKDFPANVNQHVCIIRLIHAMYNFKFYAFFMAGSVFQEQIFGNQQGVSREALNFEQLGSFFLACPPVDEQRLIADYVESNLKKIATIETSIKAVIEKLQEYRQSLITAAVTGKIKVC